MSTNGVCGGVLAVVLTLATPVAAWAQPSRDGSGAEQSDKPKQSDKPRQADKPKPANETQWDLCKPRKHQPGDAAEFVIHLNGDTSRTKTKLQHTLLLFPELDVRFLHRKIYLRATSSSESSPQTPSIPHHCYVEWDRDVFVDLQDFVPEGQLWRITVMLPPAEASGLGLGPPKATTPTAAQVDADLELMMRARFKQYVVDHPGNVTDLPSTTDAFDAALAAAMQTVTDKWTAEPANLAQMSAEVRALGRLRDEIVPMIALLQTDHYKQLLDQLRDIDNQLVAIGNKKADRTLSADQKAVLDDQEKTLTARGRPLKDAVLGALAVFSPSDGLPNSTKSVRVCADQRLAELNGRDLFTAAQWLIGTFDLPMAPTSRTLTMRVGGTASTLALEDATGLLNTWVTDVSSDLDVLSVEWTRGARTSPSLPDVLGAFTGALGAVTTKLHAGGGEGLAALVSLFATCQLDPEVDTLVALAFSRLAPLHSLVSSKAIEELDRGRSYSVSACDGPCRKDPASSKVIQLAQGTVTTYPSWGFTLFGALDYSFRMRGVHSPYFTTYQWEPSTANNAGAQLYRLDETRQPLQSVAASLFLAVRWPVGNEMLALGFGPDLILADGSGKFAQWTANFFWGPPRLFKDGIYLTAGIGFRLYDGLFGAKSGDVVEAAMAPAVLTEQHAEWVTTVGIAFDLSIISSAASSLFGAKLTSAPSTTTDPSAANGGTAQP